MEKVFIISLGCSKNLTDAEEMLGILAHKKFTVVPSEKDAGVILINTCAFIKSARLEACREIKRAARLKAKGLIKKIIVSGCLTQKEGEILPREYPAVDAFIGLTEISKIDQIIKTPAHCFNPPPRMLKAPKYKMRLTAPHSAYLKVSDGCNNCCAYCTIPSIRGRFRSKQVKDIVAEARALAGGGAKEISLIAQDTTAYGQDIYGGPSLVKLLRELVKIKTVKWWRIMYAYPENVTEDLLEFISKHKTVARYIDMPLQHISDGILKVMNRRSDSSEIRQKIAMIRRYVPDMGLRTNFIAGFPGETEEDFEKLKKFIAEIKFNNVGIFAYSKEDGTAAAKMKNQVPQKIKLARVAELTAAQSRVVDGINKKLKNKIISVMLDAPEFGRMECDAPDIDGRVRLLGGKKYNPGDIVKAKIISAEGYLRTAKILR
ncbi:MAG: 30S ribosomal protein S12 methylthiotransferase RimO [Elusimicrobium sp.]|jgi:ribosomal protein S12 methylthiotransferase|nr:30S ribosomal protein S12 methylthiotransferase RimO [Elusimicrobium sp.]